MDCEQALKHKWLVSLQANTKNLFESDGKEKRDYRPSEDGPAEGDVQSMRSMFVDCNIDRKTSNIDQIRRAFQLPDDAENVTKYKCSLSSQPGVLFVTTYDLCFMGGKKRWLPSLWKPPLRLGGKRVKIPLKEVTKVQKAKRFTFSPGKGHALKLSQRYALKRHALKLSPRVFERLIFHTHRTTRVGSCSLILICCFVFCIGYAMSCPRSKLQDLDRRRGHAAIYTFYSSLFWVCAGMVPLFSSMGFRIVRRSIK